MLFKLIEMDLDDLPVERAMLDLMTTARSVREVLIINGLESGNLARTLHGENPGTRIFRDTD